MFSFKVSKLEVGPTDSEALCLELGIRIDSKQFGRSVDGSSIASLKLFFSRSVFLQRLLGVVLLTAKGW